MGCRRCGCCIFFSTLGFGLQLQTLIGQLIRRRHLNQVSDLLRNTGSLHFAGFIAAHAYDGERPRTRLPRRPRENEIGS